MTPAEIKARLFSQCVSAEVRSALARRQISGIEMSRRMTKSNNYVAKRLRGEESFTTDDLDEICEILSVSHAEIVTAAVRSMEEHLPRRQADFGLAAMKGDGQIGPDEAPDW